MSFNYHAYSKDILSYVYKVPKESEISFLSDNMSLLELNGLGNLNSKLISINRPEKIPDFIAEHNFASQLLRLYGSRIKIIYESSTYNPPPDFEINIDGFTYIIQMKNFSKLAREVIQDRNFASIDKHLKEIPIGIYYNLELVDGFEHEEIVPLIEMIKNQIDNETAKYNIDYYNINGNIRAKVYLYKSKNIKLNHLTRGIFGDLFMIDVAGLSKKQILSSIRKGAEAFSQTFSTNSILLITVDSTNVKDMHIAEAVFGTEDLQYNRRDGYHLSRNNDGFFNIDENKTKVAGIISLRRSSFDLVSNYDYSFFLSPYFSDIKIDFLQQFVCKAVFTKNTIPS